MSVKVTEKEVYRTLMFLAVSAGLSSCVSPHAGKTAIPAAPEIVQSEIRMRKEYVLAPGDQIEVVVRRFPDLSRPITIRPDGAISLPLLNDVPAAGLSMTELDDKLTKLFAPRIVNPEVTVIALQVRPAMVYVLGDVTQASAVPFRSAPTALQAIAYSGGLKRTSSPRAISIIRLGEDGFLRAIPITVDVTGQPGPYMNLRNTPLQADDIVFVPENGRSEVSRFLQDFVNQPLLEGNLLLQPYLTFKYVQAVTK
jgi:polysaccharide biosynthesis/export protein